jgi:type I restriction enzyme, S subunit
VRHAFPASRTDWQRVAIRHLVSSALNGAWGDEEGAGEVDAACLRVADFDWDRLSLRSDKLTYRSFSKHQLKRLGLQQGDLLLEKSGGGEKTPVGRVVAYDLDLEASLTSNFVARVRPQPGLEPDFLLYLLASLYMSGWSHQFIKQNTGIQNLDQAALFDTVVSVPDLPTQKAIAAFLDQETARIDQLIEKKQRLVELLGERLNSEIESAVMGLGVSGDRKPVPGVPWIKDVPAAWSVQPLRRLLAMPITDGPHETPEFLDEGVPFVSAEAVSSGEIDFARIRGFISIADNVRYSRKYAPKTGDIFVVKSGATTGRAAIVRDFTEFNIWSPLAVLRPKDDVPSPFLLTLIRSGMFQRALSLSWSWGTQQNIGMGSLGRIAVPVPTPEERRQIGASAEGAASRANALLQPVRASIDRLKEYRSAIITAAVTGQIDVETWSRRGEGDRRLDRIEEEMAG